MSSYFKATVPSDLDGYRLDHVLTHFFPQYSRTYLQNQIKAGQVQINQRLATKSSLRLLKGQIVQIDELLEPAQSIWEGDTSISLSIAYEDEFLLVVNKPSGLVTHPAPGHLSGTLVNGLLHYLPNLTQLPRAGIVHRLDKDTSGLLVVPKTLTTHTYLVKALASRQIERIYQTLVKGQLMSGGRVNLPIGRHPTHRQKQAIHLQGKPAITDYSILERFSHYTLLSIKLQTGRTHQIRVHMAHLNHAIVGDLVYGNRGTIPFARQALHAHQLKLIHPATGQLLHCTAALPSDMEAFITTLREHT